MGKRPLEERFWSKVEKTDDCWEWTASKDNHGYGHLGINGKIIRAHRVAWELTTGPIPTGLCVLHKCDNPGCVRPDHLFIGTKADNNHDMIAKGRLPTQKGGANGHAKLKQKDVDEIRRQYANKEITQARLAAKFRVDRGHISHIVNFVRWPAP